MFKLFLNLLIVLLSSSHILNAAEDPDQSGNQNAHEAHPEELVRGERLFYGLVYQDERSVNCASCHNTRFIDTLNWNPNAHEISLKFENRTVEDLKSALLNPTGVKLSEVHANIDLSDEDIELLKVFMDHFAHEGIKQPKPVINNLLLFIIAVFVLFFVIAELIFIKRVKQKWVHMLIIVAVLFFITKTLVEGAINIGRSQGYAPDQPIKFSHVVHAGQNQTDCQYCHYSASYSKSAAIPDANVCMNCHLVVRNGSNSGTFEIAKLINAYENETPIEWVRVYNNPDHVFFSHAQHVEIGNVECQECHGAVEEMHRIEQIPDLSMGWCIKCHRETEVEFHSNEFYAQYEDLRKMIESGKIDSVTVDMVGGIECMKCHY